MSPTRPRVDPRESPLFQVTDEPLVHQLVGYLQSVRHGILEAPDEAHVIELDRSRLLEVQHAFRRSVQRGEERLYRLAQVLADLLFEGPHDLASEVVGEIVSTRERFTLGQAIDERTLYGMTDLELGVRLLRRVRLLDQGGWASPRLVASRVQVLPRQDNAHGIHRILSRIKAEESLWNKVVDEIFELDRIVRRDKQLRHLSRYVKDVFGLKIVVGTEDEVRRLHAHLITAGFPRALLAARGVPPSPQTAELEVLETKDYLGEERRKRSGWSAIKSVVRWWDRVFEIQVQPLRSYYLERERLTRESHEAWGLQREALRDQVGKDLPLFTFYRRLLLWLFQEDPGEPPTLEGVEVRIVG